MHSITLVVLAFLVATVSSSAHYPALDAVDLSDTASAYESIYDTPAHERSTRNKRGLLLLKKKLLLGLKVAKIGLLGAGAAFVLKSGSGSKGGSKGGSSGGQHSSSSSYGSYGPSSQGHSSGGYYP